MRGWKGMWGGEGGGLCWSEGEVKGPIGMQPHRWEMCNEQYKSGSRCALTGSIGGFWDY